MSFSLKRHSTLYCSVLVLFALLLCFSSAGYAYIGLDPTFGTDGLVSTDFASGDDWVRSLAIDSQGRLVVAGTCENGGSGSDFALARYTVDGELDTNFGSNGVVSTDFASGNDYGNSLAIDSQGRLVVAGRCENGSGSDFALARYTVDGELDTNFGSNGVVSTDFASGNDYGNSLAIDSQGRLVVAGDCENGSGLDFALARYTDSGELDTSFGTDGLIITDFGSSNGTGSSLAIDSQGRLVVAGDCRNGSGYDFALARYIETDELPSDGSGCSIGAISGIAGLLLFPLIFLFCKMK